MICEILTKNGTLELFFFTFGSLMADQEEEDLRMALRMSMQNSPPEPKRSKPRDAVAGGGGGASAAPAEEESPEVQNRRLQRELMAAAAEKRMLLSSAKKDPAPLPISRSILPGSDSKAVRKEKELRLEDLNLGRELTEAEANELFAMVFGAEVSKGILAQWSNQGIR